MRLGSWEKRRAAATARWTRWGTGPDQPMSCVVPFVGDLPVTFHSAREPLPIQTAQRQGQSEEAGR